MENPPLRQRGRASMDFLIGLSKASAPVKANIMSHLEKSGAREDMKHANTPESRDEIAKRHLTECDLPRWYFWIQDWRLSQHGAIATQAFEALGASFQDELIALESSSTQIETTSKPPPAYWDNVEFHRTEGGWDGHRFAGYIHNQIIHGIMVNRMFPGGIYASRRKVAKIAPKAQYEKILDMGASTGHYTLALQEAYPKAHITGIDLSLRALEQSQRISNQENFTWSLAQMDACHTSFTDNSFDLVTSFILLHELPAKAVKAVFDEAYRVLCPGADLVFSDVARFENLAPLEAWWADFFASFGGEPHWRASASLDLAALAKACGFVNVEAKSLTPFDYPHVITAQKPAS